MIYGIKYDEITGAIIMSLSSSDPAAIAAQDEVGYLTMETEARVDDSESYVVSGDVVARPTMPLIINTTSFAVGEIISVLGIPIGTTLKYPGGNIQIDDGFFDWSAAEPGVYTFTLQNFPYQEKVINATVTAV